MQHTRVNVLENDFIREQLAGLSKVVPNRWAEDLQLRMTQFSVGKRRINS